MNKWKEFKLGDLAEITSSKRIFYSDYVESGVPFWRSKEVIEQFNRKSISTDLFISIEKYNEIKTKYGVPVSNDILLTSVGSLGIPYLVKHGDSFYFKDGNLTWIRNIDTNKLYPKYLYIWLASQTGRDALSSITIGSTQEALTIIGLKSLSLKLPPLPEQLAIASMLSSLDDKIDLLHRQNKTLEAIAETLFRQWFIEEVDERWEEKTLSDVAFFFNGKSRPNEEGPIPIYGGNGILGYTNLSNYSGKSIIIGRVGAYCGSLYYENNEIWVSDNAILIKAKNEMHTHYLYYLLKTLNLNSMAEGSSHPLLTQTLLKSITCTFPFEEIIQNYDYQLQQWINKIEMNQNQLVILEKLRDTLLPKLMSGEVSVIL